MWPQILIPSVSIVVVGTIMWLALTRKLDDRYIIKPTTEKGEFVTVDKLNDTQEVTNVTLLSISNVVDKIDKSVTSNFKTIFTKFEGINTEILDIVKRQISR